MDYVTFKRDTDEQAITFHNLSLDKDLADHEIVDRLFRDMRPMTIAAEIGWLLAKYGVIVRGA